MSHVRWDGDSSIYSVVGLVMLAICGYVVVASDQAYYLHLPALWGVIAGAYILLTAVVPDLRGRDGGLLWRAFTAVLFWATTVAALVLLWRAGF